MNPLARTLRALVALAAACLAPDAGAAPAWLPDIPSQWTMIQPGPVQVGGTVFRPTCSGLPGTDPTFRFWAKLGSADGVVVFFEGGGACWDDLTCSFPIAAGLPPQVPQFYVPAIASTVDPSTFNGVFDLANPANPVRDWTFVYIPYCTADVHLGSATRDYHNAGNPVLPLPATFSIRHRGFDNFMVVLDWMRSHIVRDPNRILVTGSSAGAYGATGNFAWIAEAYPRSHLYVLADAGQGVTTVAWDYGLPGRESWNLTLPPTVVGAGEPPPRTWEILRIAAERYPHAKVSQFTTRVDGVQVAFYSVMKQFYGPGGLCPSPAADWNQQMVAALGAYAGTDNYRFYVAAGTYHTIMRSPTFYSEASAGVPFSEWLAGMLRSEGGTGGEGGLPWSDAACPDCLVPVPCGP